MAYTPVPTVIDGDPAPSAGFINQYIRDNFAAGVPDIFTTKGDLAVATGADVAARLAAGTDGSILVADSTQSVGMKWQAIPKVHAYDSSITGSLAVGNWTKLSVFNAEMFDTANAFASNRFTAPLAGYYFVSAMLVVSASGTFTVNTYTQIAIYKNGSRYSVIGRYIFEASPTGTHYIYVQGQDIVSLDKDDYIEIYYYTNVFPAQSFASASQIYISQLLYV